MVSRLEKITALFLCLAFLAFALTGCGQQNNSEEIRIGSVLELTGNASSYGQSALKGIKMAFEEINSKGGVLDKKLVLISEDNKSEPSDAANATTKLIQQDQVDALISCMASSNGIASANIAQASQVPYVAPATVAPEVTETGDYIFRVCFTSPYQGKIMAKFAIDTLKVKKIAILTDMSTDYSKGLTKFFKEEYIKLGGKIVAEEAYSQKDTDYNAQLTNLKAAKPEAIFVPGYYNEVGLIAKQAKQLGFNAPLLGADAWDSPKLVEMGGEAINGSYFVNHYSAQDTDPRIQEFVKKYKAKYGEEPDSMAALGYDAAIVLADAIKRAGSTDKKAVRDALAATKDFQAVTGILSMDAERNPVKSAVILEIKDGKQTFVQKINP